MKNFILAILTISVFVFNLQVKGNSETKNDYPKSKLEKEMDEMGSALGGKGVVFRPAKVKSTDTRAKIGNVNKYLYQGALEVLKSVPLMASDSHAGVITTDWYTEKEGAKIRFKVNVYIKDDVITPEAVEVKAFQQEKVYGDWKEYQRSNEKAASLEEEILRKARDLYQKSKK